MASRLDALARRVQTDPAFLAAALADYARSERLDEHGLAAALGCPVDALTPLRLCLRPRPAPPHFRQDVEQIAARFGVRPAVLAEVVRRADALAALRRAPAADAARGTLMAARDREAAPDAAPSPADNSSGAPDPADNPSGEPE
ncbi:MAG TPA: hypothetical protein VII06_29915 [Chloroflexota bacterium]|jgi:hypothetical protein